MNQIKLIDLIYDDIQKVRNWRNSPEISDYMYTDDVISYEQQESWFNRLIKDDSQKVWIIEYNSIQIGVAYLYSIKQNFKTCYWGFYIGEKDFRGKGLGNLIEYQVIDYVFNRLFFNKLLCEVLEFNYAVIKLHEKYGFRREGFFREHILKNNQFLNVVSLGLLKSEWVKLNKNFN